ncbi:hypothetical protein KKA00_00205, partial [bacterium]|nr:hypothetical protein [bacterium]
MILRNGRIACLLVLAAIISTSSATTPPPMTADFEWKGRIVVEISEELEPLQVQNVNGIANIDFTELDVLVAR